MNKQANAVFFEVYECGVNEVHRILFLATPAKVVSSH